MSAEALVHAVLGDGYFGSIDRGDMRNAASHVALEVEMVFDPENDLHGRAAVLKQLEVNPADEVSYHRIHDVIAAELHDVVMGLGSLETVSAEYRFAVLIDTKTREITHFVTQMLPRLPRAPGSGLPERQDHAER